ncbi:alpha/beta fold hydrolase [Antrihabitans sp. YC2-6]|uniref:alpha/beta fold hydrolase n=1 Tax=Antrihabitans sp. YC2-6 TaxID=2799498 RepID=UPI0018F2E98B|nr:alpha/beta hydrolase [Antrihabitans sp. YC2-6]MBJ8345041.1 alpha/beta hydrolase [Antrihabitans sp. YC2-6]
MGAPRPLRPVTEVEPRLIFRTIHGYRRAIRIAGDGPPLVLLHGIGDNSETWLDIIPHFATKYTVIAPDMLGHGQSDKPRADYSAAAYANGLRDLLSVLGHEKVTLVGHSLGGGVAMQFAYQYPHLVDRIVIVCAGGVSREINPLLRMSSVPVVPLVLHALSLPGATTALDMFGRFLAALNATTGTKGASLAHDAIDVVRVLAAQSDRMGHRAFVKTIRAVADWRGQTITVLDRCYLFEGIPVQIVWGRCDAIIPVRHAHIAHAAMPGSTLEIFDEAGHFPFRDDPIRFAGLVQRFLDSTTPAQYEQERWRAALSAGHAVDSRRPHPSTQPALFDAMAAAERSAT